MAMAVNHPRRFGWHRTGAAPMAATEARVRARPLGASLTGLGALLVGAWGALAVYVGPYFGFKPTTSRTWDWNLQNGMLHLLPGAVAFAAGLMILAIGPARRGAGRALTLPAVLLMAAGAWFVIGPVAWPTFETGAAYAAASSATRELLNQACANLAPGLVLAALGGMAWKAGVARPVIETLPEAPGPVAPAAASTSTAPVTDAGPLARADTAATDTTTVSRAPETRIAEGDPATG